MILLPPGSPGGDCAKCMVIDFGRARLGRAQEQDMEVRQLRRLLGKVRVGAAAGSGGVA
ncbi:hypothetical protein TSOC_007541 [Tetrabaena socialis]|uniref:Uncharacterized protein n=1 Tax=Tetrabaena socialis TaxID=47790 RepID=A0A2J8A0W6_9CHLO|nr:hypothetical protein TSOC_007541 [Tetrabaena socialis]|eukprot:PNH06128.1 hypothetical protein TSOC_007541 [Tetrabaena socialis]